MKMFNNKIIVLYFVSQIVLSGSAYSANLPADQGVIWEAGTNEFIKYMEQGNSDFDENDHPVTLNVDEISKALGSLRIPGSDRGSADQEQQSVFTVEQIDVLSQNLARGLASAQPNQDIHFALEKRVKRFLGFKPNRLFVAGKAFYKDEKLNIIIGDYDRAADEGFEAAYDPTHVGIVRYHFDHGRRTKSSKAFKTPIISAQGIENKQLRDRTRTDWFVIDLKTASEASDLKVAIRKREEQAKKRKELEEILGGAATIQSHPAEAEPASATKPPSAAEPTPATRSFEERFNALNRLRDKGLITEEEYAMKRKQILEEL